MAEIVGSEVASIQRWYNRKASGSTELICKIVATSDVFRAETACLEVRRAFRKGSRIALDIRCTLSDLFRDIVSWVSEDSGRSY